MSDKTYMNRRKVLRTTGGLLGLVGIMGTAAAACYEMEAVTTYADVHDDCNGDPIGYVTDGTTGVSCDKCFDENGDTWWYLEWYNGSPDGWVHDSQVERSW